MHALFAGAAIGAILTTTPPPRVAPKLSAYAAVDTAAGSPTPAAGFALTHRECSTDEPVRTALLNRFPFGAAQTGLTGPSVETLLAVDTTTKADPTDGFYFEGFEYREHKPAALPAYTLPHLVTLLGGWDAATRRPRFVPSPRWGGLNSVQPTSQATWELRPFVERTLMLTGHPAELAALLRDCAASPHKMVRDYGRSLRALTGD